MIKAVVFDLDHTLFDRYATFSSILSLPKAYTVFNEVLGKEKLLKLWSNADKELIHLDNPWPRVYANLKKANALLPDIEEEAFYKKHIVELYKLTAVLYDDTLSTLNQLREAGFALGIITNGLPSTQNSKIALLGIKPYVDEIIISGEYNIDKPDRKLFDIMADRLSLKSEEMLYVGDHPLNDIEGARNAGYKTAWINATGRWSLPEIKRADYEINRLSELCSILIK